VGSYAIQLAIQKGATATGVCSGSNLEMVKSLGAQNAIDYKLADYSEDQEKFDVVFDAVGKTTKTKAKKVLNTGGAFVSIKMLTKEKDEHLRQIRELVEKGNLKPFIDKSYSLDEIVSAHTYVERGRKRGNVVIEVLQ
jgi:NADPH:quinone reductase-like Zn-dependent oxidoreductase